jgi:mono/diheme cytochrome c family protein
MKNWLLILAFTLLPAAGHADGSELFEEFCVNCHGDNSAPIEAFDGTPERFRELMEGASEDMPDFYGVFSDEEIAALYEYINGPDFKPVD